nr:ATP-binding protein [Enhygromyxa salina]
MAAYYTEKERYVGRIAGGLPNFFILLGDKGVGKSAIQEMLANELKGRPRRVVKLKPEDIAIFSLTKDRLIEPSAGIDQRWFAKTLWTYLICVEIVRREFHDFEGLWQLLKARFRGDARRAKRLFEKAYSPEREQSMADRFVALVAEIELEHVNAGGATSARLQTRESSETMSRHSVLHDLRELERRLDETLDHDYLILFDELDQDWNAETGQRVLLEQLIVAAESLSRGRGRRVSSCISMRKDIFATLNIDNADKMRDSLVHVSWEAGSLAKMVERRIQHHGKDPNDKSLDTIFSPDCSREKMWAVASGNPRRAIQIVERSILRTQELGGSLVERSVHLEVLRECSDQFLQDNETVHRVLYPDLRKVALLLRGQKKSFGYADFEFFALRVAEASDAQQMPGWATESAGHPLRLALHMLKTGVLLAKLNRKDVAKPFNETVHPLDDSLWFEIHSAYALALGVL